jgi:hypothetical protein
MKVTTEGVPLQEWDFFSETTLLVKASENAEPDILFGADIIKEVISKGDYRASFEDMRSLTRGDRQVFGLGFDNLLLALSLAPAGSVKTLNILAHSTSSTGLDFSVEFVYRKDAGKFDFGTAIDHEQRAFVNVDLKELITFPPEINVNGVPVKLSDVRRAFPVDGEVHVFNMTNILQEELVQALANLFQVRTTGFTQKPVRVKASVITETRDDELVLSRKIDVGFANDPATFQVNSFSELLLEDRARTGLFTAFPRRV